jgi:pimeloyl-ACP methyl ester carboxylesterase
MRIEANGCRLYVDIVGSGLVAEGPVMVERPVVFILHGGPGFDHSTMKPTFDPLAEVAQLVYYDHRGQGRSDRHGAESWNLDQWADDLRALVDVLGVEKPIVLGLSFGGFVAQSYAARHPDRLHKLILASTVARVVPQLVFDAFERFGGERARAAAEGFWGGPSAENAIEYLTTCMPLYNQSQPDPDVMKRAIVNLDVISHFSNPGGGEHWSFDFREALSGLRCPTLVTAGALDPITPIEAIEELASCIPAEYLRFEAFENCGHGVHHDDPTVFDLMKEFIRE